MPIFCLKHTAKIPLPLLSLAAGLNCELMAHEGEYEELRGLVVAHYIERKQVWALAMDVTAPNFVDEAFRLLHEKVAQGPVSHLAPNPCRRPDAQSVTHFPNGMGNLMGVLLYRRG